MTAITTDCVVAAPPSGAALPLQTAFVSLIPSQVPNARHPTPKKKERQKSVPVALHAQDVDSNQYNILDDDDDDSGGDVVVYKPPSATASDESVASRTSKDSKAEHRMSGKTRRGKVVLSRTGNLPDVHW